MPFPTINDGEAGSSVRAKLNALLSVAPELVIADRTYYVRNDGNNNNTGLVNSSGGAFASIQHAVETVSRLDLSGKAVDIQVVDGTYPEWVLPRPYRGMAKNSGPRLLGNPATPANVIIRPPAGAHAGGDQSYGMIEHAFPCPWEVNGFSVDAVNTDIYAAGIVLQNGAMGVYQNMRFLATQDGAACYEIYSGSMLQTTGSNSVVGPVGGVLYSDMSLISFGGTLTLVGTPDFADYGFLSATNSRGYFGASYVGSATGKRFDLARNSYFSMTGAAALPGDVAGTIDETSSFDGLVGCNTLQVTDGIAAPTAIAGKAQLFIDTADGDLKIIYGDGTVKTIITDTP